jgi:hypothetical protein
MAQMYVAFLLRPKTQLVRRRKSIHEEGKLSVYKKPCSVEGCAQFISANAALGHSSFWSLFLPSKNYLRVKNRELWCSNESTKIYLGVYSSTVWSAKQSQIIHGLLIAVPKG